MKRDLVPEETDELLREWAFFFRDVKKLEHCRSIEHRFRRVQGEEDPDGWGDMESAPKVSPARSYSLRRALLTHEAIGQLDRLYKWAITYGYAYPGLPKFVVLRCMKKFTGRRLSWAAFMDVLDIGVMRVHTTISCANRLTASTF